MFAWLKSALTPPSPAGPPEQVCVFGVTDALLARDGVTVEDGAWRIESEGPRTVSLFEITDPGIEQCVLSYRARIRTANLKGGAFLEMWCRLPGRGDFFSKGFAHRATGTTDWVSHEVPFFLKQGQSPDLIKLDLAIDGRGTVWIRDVEVLMTPLA